jgi:hypothetical protein
VSCDICHGTYEIPLLGANTTDCPECDLSSREKVTFVSPDGEGRWVQTRNGVWYDGVLEAHILIAHQATVLVRSPNRNIRLDHESFMDLIAYYQEYTSLKAVDTD